MTRVVPALMLALLLMIGITAGYFALSGPADSGSAAPPGGFAVQNLNATLWVQTGAEYRAAALQAYRLATLRLEQALADPTWTAVPAQRQQGRFATLPPAVIVDVDETVLDNSPHQARQILDDVEFNREDWHAWVREEQAQPVPGAVAFARVAAERGVTVFYVTNRQHEVEEATRRNLERAGFPVAAQPDTVLSREERPEWGSDKESRRRAVASGYRVVLLIGDNLGDFLADVNRDPAARVDLVRQHEESWGREWIVLPNPQYGSWEGALIDYQYALPRADKLARKLAALDPRRQVRQ